LRSGKIREATSILTKLANSFPVSYESTNATEFVDSLYTGFESSCLFYNLIARNEILGELGVLRLSQGQFASVSPSGS
jgi:hypothetical protein